MVSVQKTVRVSIAPFSSLTKPNEWFSQVDEGQTCERALRFHICTHNKVSNKCASCVHSVWAMI